jgi:predicted RNase H-like HicB family nuclease
MQTLKYIYWQEDDAWLGYLLDFPDYWTQGETFDDLVEHLKDLYQDLTSGKIPGIRRLGELVVA